MMRAVCLAGALVFALPPLLVTAASAEVIKLQAELKGSNEVPPNTSSGSGKAEAAFDTDTKGPDLHGHLRESDRSRARRAFPWTERGRQECRHRASVQICAKPDPGNGDPYRGAGC